MPATSDWLAESPGVYVSSTSPAYQAPIAVGTASRGTIGGPSAREQVEVDWDSWFSALARHLLAKAAEAFAGRVAAIPEVRAVTLEADDAEPQLTTYIDRRDLDVRGAIYGIEFEVCQEHDLEAVSFRIISMDNSACSIPEADAGITRVLYRRNSWDHAELRSA